jgi:hypothetical protein
LATLPDLARPCKILPCQSRVGGSSGMLAPQVCEPVGARLVFLILVRKIGARARSDHRAYDPTFAPHEPVGARLAANQPSQPTSQRAHIWEGSPLYVGGSLWMATVNCGAWSDKLSSC